MSDEDRIQEIVNMSDEDRIQEIDSLLRGLEQVFTQHFTSQGLTMIPRYPPHEVIMAMCEVQRGKRSKQEYMAIVYQQIVAHFRG